MITTLRTGPDIDWRSKCHPGDNQGSNNACAVFAIANWVEAMYGRLISDQDAIDAWYKERMFRYRDAYGGLQITEAFAAAYNAGWLLRGTQIRRVSSLQTLSLAPIVAAYTGIQWKADHAGRISDGPGTGNHAVLIVGHIANRIWIENSHSSKWGADGFGWMVEQYHVEKCVQLCQVIEPGAPTTEQEAARKAAASLAQLIGDHVTSISRNLAILGYILPASGGDVITDVMRRSMAGELSAAQNEAKRDLADAYLILRGQGVTDAQINAVWEVINNKNKETK